jgi:hypothetical protein
MHLCASPLKLFRSCVATSQTHHLVASQQQLSNDRRTDEACGSGDEDFHIDKIIADPPT